MQIFHHTAARYNSSDQALNTLLRQQSFQIQQRNAIMAAQHIYGVDLMIAQFISPSGQVTAILIFNGIQHQPRQEEIIEAAEICIKYEGYIEREKLIADKIARLENIRIKGKFDYSTIQQISIEARQKLAKIDPETIAQASRIPGISPSDINILLVLLGR